MRSINLLIILSVGIISCGKTEDGNNPKPKKIDVSSVQYTDNMGNELGISGSGPTVGFSFTAEEKALFNSMDTANLTGTTKPAIPTVPGIYPNPFKEIFYIVSTFEPGFSGNVVVKYVITDSLLKPLFKNCMRVKGITTIALMPNLPVIKPIERYRLYITLSAEGHNNFYTKWANIERRD